jgi:hypothetical protein
MSCTLAFSHHLRSTADMAKIQQRSVRIASGITHVPTYCQLAHTLGLGFRVLGFRVRGSGSAHTWFWTQNHHFKPKLNFKSNHDGRFNSGIPSCRHCQSLRVTVSSGGRVELQGFPSLWVHCFSLTQLQSWIRNIQAPSTPPNRQPGSDASGNLRIPKHAR